MFRYNNTLCIANGLKYEMRKFGYARVSTSQQCLDVQINALKNIGIEEHRILCDKQSGKEFNRPGLESLLIKMEKGDELYVHKLDRLGRDTAEMIKIIKDLKAKDIVVHFLSEGISSGGTMGMFTITIISAVAEAERERMMERIREGRVEAIRKGKKMGPKFKINRQEVLRMKKERYGATEISRALKIGRDSVYRILKEDKQRKEEDEKK